MVRNVYIEIEVSLVVSEINLKTGGKIIFGKSEWMYFLSNWHQWLQSRGSPQFSFSRLLNVAQACASRQILAKSGNKTKSAFDYFVSNIFNCLIFFNWISGGDAHIVFAKT